jgi:ubiquinone/menaquinone biosynthesis C-methylase UbiE
MNAEHLRLCSSAEWAEHIETTLFPWVLDDIQLGEDVIEVGPGPGLTTERLRTRVKRLTAVESDASLANALATRLANSNVEVIHADATSLPFDNGRFSAAACFTMLHHVPSPALQDKLLSEVARVLRPGGVLLGVDSLDSPAWRKLHEGDVCVPIDPLGFSDRLQRAGFEQVSVTVWSIGTRFEARTPV